MGLFRRLAYFLGAFVNSNQECRGDEITQFEMAQDKYFRALSILDQILDTLNWTGVAYKIAQSSEYDNAISSILQDEVIYIPGGSGILRVVLRSVRQL